MKLEIIIASTRPQRVGAAVADWFIPLAQREEGVEVSVADLAEINLPLLDEPNHPRLGQYTKGHTKEWSARIDAADAFVVVTPEYNYAAPASLINAFDYLYNEWNYKPVGFVSYGGVSGGVRAVQDIKGEVTTLKMVPLVEAVNIPFVAKQLDEVGNFTPNEKNIEAAGMMLGELRRWSDALKTLRTRS